MQVLLRQVKIVDPNSPHHDSIKDILVKDDEIVAVRKRISSDVRQIDLQGWNVSPGFVDIGAYCGEPGEEHIESFDTLSTRALHGGYTGVATLPNTNPRIQTASDIGFVKGRTKDLPIDIYPLGAITKGQDGSMLAELMDMHVAGAHAFTDGLKSIDDVGMMHRALEYAKSRDILLINRPQHNGLRKNGSIHEGNVSVSLGLPGIPRLSEIMMVKRDLDLVRYAKSPLLIHCISCAESVELIKAAKTEGLPLFASVSALNLVYTDEALQHFDSNFKVMPPLRGEADRKALLEGVLDGTIDVICSNHRPLSREQKDVEFPFADFGALGLARSFNLALDALGRRRKLDTLVDRLAIKPREILRTEPVVIQKDGMAELTIFRTDQDTDASFEESLSEARNMPAMGTSLLGRIGGTINKGKVRLKV